MTNIREMSSRKNHLIDVQEVKRAYQLLTVPGQIVEIRALEASREQNSRYTETIGGYFDNINDLLREVSTIRVAMGIYMTLQPGDPQLLHRAKNKLVKQKKDLSTSDKHITHYQWLPIDSDPERISNISATEEEHQRALAHSRKIRDALKELGWPDPIETDSGNGGHLQYRINLPTSESQLIKRVLEGLAERFDENGIHVDRTLYNPSRIIKLYGTLACKGDNTEERPHRLSRVLAIPEGIQIVSREMLEAMVPQAEEKKPSTPYQVSSNGYKPPVWVRESRNLEFYIQKYQIKIKSSGPYNGGTRHHLEACVWDPSHTDDSACLYEDANGRLGAKCSHNSCEGKHWREFRLHFEPDAYTPKEPKVEQKQAAKEATPSQDLPVWRIKNPDVLQALINRDKQGLYALAGVIAEMDAIEQDRIRLAAFDVWGGSNFPMRDFTNLLRSAKEENERKRIGEPAPISAYDLMLKQFPPIEYAVPELLPMGLIVLGGKQKIGKSWLDLNIAMAVASGGIALGKYQVKQGEALYLALEDTERRLQDRIGQLLGPGSIAPKDLHIETKWPRLDNNGIAKLEAWIIAHPNTRLIIIDPWVKVKPRLKSRNGETGYDAEYEALAGIKELADKYGICILIQFHLRKANADDPFDELNATTGVTACADGFISIKRGRGDAEGTIYASGRDYKEEVNLAISFNNGFWKVLGDGQTAIYYTLSQERRAIIDFLDVALTPMMPKDIAVLVDGSDDSEKTRKLLYKMKNDDQIKWVEEDKETGTKPGYVTLIPSPKTKRDNFANCVDAVDAVDSIDAVDAVDVYGNHRASTERLRSVYGQDAHVEEPVEPSNGVEDTESVYGVYGVYASTENSNSESEPIPLPLLQEYKDLYRQLQQTSPEKVAPHGTLQWFVPDSDMAPGQIPFREYGIRLQALGRSKDVQKVRAGLEEIRRKLGQIN